MIQEAVEWSYDKRTRSFEAKLPGNAAVTISTSSVAKADPRLPIVLRAIARSSDHWRKSTSTLLQLADRVRRTIDFWGEESPLLAWDADGPMYVGRIHTAVSSAQIGMVHIQADTWCIRKYSQDISYIDGVEELKALAMSNRVLEDHYPGLESRLVQGEILGLSPADMAHHIFYNVQVEAESLPRLDVAAVSA